MTFHMYALLTSVATQREGKSQIANPGAQNGTAPSQWNQVWK